MTAGSRIVEAAGAAAPWLVMVHGMSQDQRYFSAQEAAFAQRYRLLLIDLPGHGLSADIAGPYGRLEMAIHVGAAITAAGAVPCHYWGTHTGTALAMLLAANAPELRKGASTPSSQSTYSLASACSASKSLSTSARPAK